MRQEIGGSAHHEALRGRCAERANYIGHDRRSTVRLGRSQEMDGRIWHYSHPNCSGVTSAPSISLSPTWAVTHTPQRMTSLGTHSRVMVTKRADLRLTSPGVDMPQSFLVPAVIPGVPVPKMPMAFLVKAPPATGLIPVMDTVGIRVESGLAETKNLHDSHFFASVCTLLPFREPSLGEDLSAQLPRFTVDG
jgi:hypothetical protein